MVATIEADGCLLTYKVEGQGEPAIFIQGAGVHGDGWLPQTQELKSRFQCVTFDSRGMGSSQAAGCEITVAQTAQDTLTVMNAAGIASAHSSVIRLGERSRPIGTGLSCANPSISKLDKGSRSFGDSCYRFVIQAGLSPQPRMLFEKPVKSFSSPFSPPFLRRGGCV